MYNRILVAVENSPADRTILAHVRSLAALTGAELLLVHVADGFAARHFKDLGLRESEETGGARESLKNPASDRAAQSIITSTELARGAPATELIRLARERNVDLIAMATH